MSCSEPATSGGGRPVKPADYSRTIREAVGKALGEGRPGPANVARRLGVSERMLLRRIAEEGTTFRALLAETRRELEMSSPEYRRAGLRRAQEPTPPT